MLNFLKSLYQRTILSYPKLVVVLFAFVLVLLFQYSSNFRLDASSDSLVLENDEALKYYREVIASYDASDILMLTYSPKQELFSDEVLEDIRHLREQVLALEGIQSMLSIVDVPLTQSPPVTLSELNGSPRYLLDEGTNRALAKEELRNSQLYRKLLVSDDYSVTSLVIYLQGDKQIDQLFEQRNALRELRDSEGLNAGQQQELESVSLAYQAKRSDFQTKQNELVAKLRELMAQHDDKATLFLGGVPMIVTDSIRFIQGDVVVFGVSALLVIIFILIIAFRQTGWVVMPLITCFATGYIMVCLLGLLNWPISVVSSNFLSLLLIITLSLTIHLIVRYRELANDYPEYGQHTLVTETVNSKFIPCIYTSLTTIVAFASLIVSGIRPVIDFGWIMCLGIIVSFITAFTLFPALVLLLKPAEGKEQRDPITAVVLNAAMKLQRKSSIMASVFVFFTALAAYGIAHLSVENRFIDYFKPETEIYQGMVTIDKYLGGTTPLDIIIDAPESHFIKQEQVSEPESEVVEEDDFFDDFDDLEDDFFDEGSDTSQNTNITSSYWYNEAGLARARAIHDSLEALPETGKVLSIANSMSLFDNLKNAKPMDDIDLGFMYQVLSETNKNTLFKPYLSEDGNQAHINIRVFETQKGLNRNQLIQSIEDILIQEHDLEPEQVHISGMVVLYNNMLNSLFESQIMTLSTVFLAIFLMFIILFKSIKLALITIIPNIFSASVVLGLMGIFSIPLDLMTITIAAISVGIAVDNSIHYVHRFRDEFALTPVYASALEVATNNIGKAMFYTTLVITTGFIIMVFSNFVPTMYFGILTAIAMLTALLANLLMLPMLIGWLEPVKNQS